MTIDLWLILAVAHSASNEWLFDITGALVQLDKSKLASFLTTK